MKTSVILSISVMLLAIPHNAPASSTPNMKPRVFHVKPNGDDARKNGPFATLAGASRAVQDYYRSVSLSYKADVVALPVEVIIHEGTYFLDEPLVLSATNPGNGAVTMTWRANKGDRPIISGGLKLTGWQETEHNGLRAWQVAVPKEKDWSPRQLFANGQRRSRTRLPKEGFYQLVNLPDVTSASPWNVGQRRAEFKPGDILPWQNLSDVEVMALHLWSDSRLPIKSVDASSNMVEFGKASVFRMTDDNMGMGVSQPGSRYWVENAAEALDTPGQWYFNTKSRVLTYLPMEGETLKNTEMITPRLKTLVEIEAGTRGMIFEGLTFAHQEWMYGRDQSGSPQAEVYVPGAVQITNASECAFRDCTIEHIAGYAIELLGSSRNNAIERCRMTDLGAGGVKIGHGTSFTTVSDCTILDGGIIFPSAIGVWIGNSGDNTVIHNEIGKLYYTGISVGWTWGYGPSNAARNIIEYNHIHDIGRGLLSDMGGIYCLGIAPGTRLRYNRIHDIESHMYGGWGLYTDEGSSGVLLEKNLVYRTKSAGFHQHYGRENVIRNNIFVFGGEAGAMRTRIEEHLSFVFERNIVVTENGRITKGGGWDRGRSACINNVYFDINNTPLDFAGETFEKWKERSLDYTSVNADPLFVDLKNEVFCLEPQSPAIKLGFEPFDYTRAGPREP